MSACNSSPVMRICNSAERFSSAGKPLAKQLCELLDNEMCKSFIGPMPVDEFFQAFLPTLPETSRAEKEKWAGFEGVSAAGLEKQMYGEFINVANSLCANFRADNTSDNPGEEPDAKFKPDVTFYGLGRACPERPITSFQQMEMFVEFKRGSASDPFREESGGFPFQKSYDTTCALRGQMTLYATRMQRYQFRTFVFSVGIFGHVARLFRWDRSGVVVSKPIMYSEEGNRELSEFFHRFDLANRTQRGWDPTVSDATPEQSAAFTKAIETVVGAGENNLLESLLESVGDEAKYPRKNIYVFDPKSGKRISYLVGRSTVSPESPTGRCTRGFVAMKTEDNRLVFLKDTWRPDVSEMKPESHWFSKLEEATNVAAFSYGSDVEKAVLVEKVRATRSTKKMEEDMVRYQRTLTHTYAKGYCQITNMMGYIHYRTVQNELYVPLKMFKDSKHLAEVMNDVLLAIEDLYRRGILHRDISINNIMITIWGRGRLIDFDLARELSYQGARQTMRTGTWQFMSTRILSVPGKIHELCDDLESHFFVILYNALHFIKQCDGSPKLDMEGIFDQSHVFRSTGQHSGGMGKESMYSKSFPVKFTSKRFTKLIHSLFSLFALFSDYHSAVTRGVSFTPEAAEAAERLKDCEEIKSVFANALARDGWPTDSESDKVDDQYPSARRLTSEQKETVKLSYLKSATEPTGKRKRDSEDDDGDAPVPQWPRNGSSRR